jgi:hypothetical protein
MALITIDDVMGSWNGLGHQDIIICTRCGWMQFLLTAEAVVLAPVQLPVLIFDIKLVFLEINV